MDFFDLERENTYKTFLRTVAKLVRQKRICAGKTVEDIAYDALAHNSTSFYSSAENFSHGKHFNLKHLFLSLNIMTVISGNSFLMEEQTMRPLNDIIQTFKEKHGYTEQEIKQLS